MLSRFEDFKKQCSDRQVLYGYAVCLMKLIYIIHTFGPAFYLMTPIVYCRKIGDSDFNFCNMDEICGKKNMEFYVGNFP